ncbi:unnamed protein product [Nesidiocoris tenuis]|uniref:Uncharacterized protein n=1 Tax=Nesidiocoris tenuis TaxID=355587 RepID=A0A6H5HS88_9HEMI|nr:unnamed protein product [Nesidiocoris tenuis]
MPMPPRPIKTPHFLPPPPAIGWCISDERLNPLNGHHRIRGVVQHSAGRRAAVPEREALSQSETRSPLLGTPTNGSNRPP